MKRKTRDDDDGQRRYLVNSTYRCALLKALLTPAWQPVIESAVQRVARIVHEASLLLNLHFARLIAEGRPLPQLTQTLFNHCIANVAETGKHVQHRQPEIKETYERLYHAHQPSQTSARYIAQALSYARNDYVVAWKNYLEFGTPRHRVHYLMAKYDLTKTQARSLNDARTNDTGMNADNILSGIVATERRLLPVMPSSETVPDKKEREAAYEALVVRYRFMMLDTIERADPECQRYRRFTLAPVHDVGRAFITIDNKVALDLLAHAKSVRCSPDWDSETLRRQWVESWTDLFRSNALRRFSRKDNVELASVCRTDGVQLHVIVDRWLKSRPRDLTTRDAPPVDVDTAKVTSVDPGHRCVVTAWDGSESFQLSKGEYYDRCGYLRAQRARRQWMDQRPDLRVEEADPERSLKRTSLPLLVRAVSLRLRALDEVHAFYGAKRWARLKFDVATHKQRTLDAIANKLCPTDQHTVAFGAAKFAAGMKGQKPGPVTLVRDHLIRKKPGRVVLVDEYNTSKMCSACGERLHHPRMACGSQRRVCAVHGLCQCQTGCHRTWDRDANAARNIWRAFIEEYVHGSRPRELSRATN